jgi:Putative prokaryotic signal transducing protein
LSPPPERSGEPSRRRRRLTGVPRGWVVVASAPDQIAAGMLQSAVEGAGIPVMLLRPGAFAYTGIGGQHGVMVPQERAAEARDILREIWDIEGDDVE